MLKINKKGLGKGRMMEEKLMKEKKEKELLDEMIWYFCNFYETEKGRKPTKQWKNFIANIFVQRTRITLADIRENHLAIYSMRDKAISDMIGRLRNEKNSITEETMIAEEEAFTEGGEIVLRDCFSEAELNLLEVELARRALMKRLFRKRELQVKKGILIFEVQREIIKEWRKLYEGLASKGKGDFLTLEDIQKNSLLVKKMKNRAIIDMSYRMRKKTKKTFGILNAIGTLKEGTTWEDIVDEGYWALVNELEERRRLRELARKAKRREQLENEDGDNLVDVEERMDEAFGNERDEDGEGGGVDIERRLREDFGRR